MKSNGFRSSAQRYTWIFRSVAGAGDQVRTLSAGALILALLTLAASILLVRVLGLGPYAEHHLLRHIPLALMLWGIVSLAILLVALKISLALSERVAGPVRRMERALDRAIEGKTVQISMRDDDALAALALRINHLIKTLPADHHDHT